MRAVAAALPAVLLGVVLAGAGCAVPGTAGRPGSSRPIRVVAAENFWGSLARQVGGPRVQVTSLISRPDTDPHDYEPTAADARAMAIADYVVINGVGYDGWADNLLRAARGSQRVLRVGDLVGAAPGGNPHRWYDPDEVDRVVGRMTTDLAALDPPDAPEINDRGLAFSRDGLAGYHALIARIRSGYAGTPVGASESIFAMLAPALGLDLITPPGLLRAVSEGDEVSPADREAALRQIRQHQIRIYVYNSQNATPDVRAQVRLCRDQHIPVAQITETLVPASATFQQWQQGQLQQIAGALAEARGSQA